MKYPPVVIVDANDKVVGTAMLRDAKKQGLLFRVVAIVVADEQGRILLQKRSSHVDIDPNTWDISAGGHVDEGQTYDIAAAKELQEELGIADLQPKLFAKEFMDVFFLQLYRLTIPADTELHPSAAEVTDTRWLTAKELQALVHDHPEQCAEFLRNIYRRVPEIFA